jgi:hypothetical protein
MTLLSKFLQKHLSPLLVLSILIAAGGCKFHSSSVYSNDALLGETANDADNAVYAILNDGRRCTGCHETVIRSAASLDTDLIAAGWVKAKSPGESKLLTRLINSDPTTYPTDAAKDMPQTGTPLTTAQIQVLADWVTGLSDTPGGGGTVREQKFNAARAIILSKCMGCHDHKPSPSDTTPYTTVSENDFWNSNWGRSYWKGTPGSPATWLMITRLAGNNPYAGAGNTMPNGAPALSDAEINIIIDYANDTSPE